MAVDVEELVREYIDKIVHLSLGTSADDKPWVCEVHFAYDDDLNLYYRSLTSRRHSKEIAKNPFVAGNIVKQHALGEAGKGIYFEGQAKLLDPGDEQDAAYRCISKRLQVGQEILDDAKDPSGHQFYKITVSKWYVFGPFDGQPSQKYELDWKT